jgi:hypothetical protein
MNVAHTIFLIIFAMVTGAALVLAAEELVHLKRRKKFGWRAISTPAARRFRDCLVLIWLGVTGLIEQWRNVAVLGAAVTILVAILIWNIRLTRRLVRR